MTINTEQTETPFNAALMLLYDMTIANAPMLPGDCRDIADKVGTRIGECRDGIKSVLVELEKIETPKLAAKGLFDEANAISRARVLIDRLIGFDRV